MFSNEFLLKMSFVQKFERSAIKFKIQKSRQLKTYIANILVEGS